MQKNLLAPALIVLAVFTLGLDANAEMLHAIKEAAKQALSGVVGGRRATPELFPAAALLVQKNEKGEVVGFCSGTIFERGCVLTAGHCNKKGVTLEIYTGNDPFNVPNATPMSVVGEAEVLSDTKLNPESDIAVMKLYNPLPEIWPTKGKKDLPETPAKIQKMENGLPQLATIFGYGHHHTEEVMPQADPNDIKPGNLPPAAPVKGITVGDLQDVGGGTLRSGTVELLGYAKKKAGVADAAQDFPRQLAEDGNIIVTRNSPHGGAEGDSGMPLIVKGKIAGIQSDASNTLGQSFVEPKKAKGGPWASEVMHNTYTSTFHNKEWIEKAVAKLGCHENTLDNAQKNLAKIAKADLIKENAQEAWDAYPEKKKAAFLTELLRSFRYTPDVKVKSAKPKTVGDAVHFDLDLQRGENTYRVTIGVPSVASGPFHFKLRE